MRIIQKLSVICVMALALTNLNTCCMFWSHQVEVPEELL